MGVFPLTLSLVRLNYSPYHNPLFAQQEAAAFKSLGLPYHSYEKFHKLPPGKLILISNSQTELEKIPTEIWKRTKLLIQPNSGYDNISHSFLKQNTFPIIVGNPIRAQAVANYILAQFFGHFNPSPHRRHWDPSRQWPRTLPKSLKVLLIGMGHVGTLVYQTLLPMVQGISRLDPFKGHPHHSKIELAKKNNIILPLCSLNPTSHHIIDRAFLEALPPDFVLINGARGKLVDQKALVNTLNQRPNAFAYLDVFEREPFQEDDFALLKHHNLKCSSHVAGVFDGLDEETIKFNISVCRDFIHSPPLCSMKYKDLILQNRQVGGVLI